MKIKNHTLDSEFSKVLVGRKKLLGNYVHCAILQYKILIFILLFYTNRESFDWLKNLLGSLEVGRERIGDCLHLATPDEAQKLT